MTVNEIDQVIIDVNSTNCKYNKGNTIIQEFEIQVNNHPNRTALMFKNKKYTYAELSKIVNSVAYSLIHGGIKSNSVVGIYMEKSDKYIISILAVLKCGCAYLPLDKVYPALRIRKMLEIGNVQCVIVDENINEDESIFSGIQCIEFNQSAFQSIDNVDNWNNCFDSNSLAYIIFTSGSTGDPKGIAIKQYSVINLVCALTYRVKAVGDCYNVGLLAPIVFDASVGQIFFALLTGKTLTIIPDDIKGNPIQLMDYMSYKRVDLCDVTPQYLHMLVKVIKHEKKNICLPNILFSVGEALPLNIVNEFYELDNTEKSILINCYGPAEACVYVSFFTITKELVQSMKEMYIGKPIFNTSIYILDEDKNICPVGVEGELCISGDGLAKGYINQAQLTNEKFVLNPYKKNELMYMTGDVAKWTSSGDIVYLGRNDSQVKIRGFRIELEEIEKRLNEIEEIEQSKIIVNRNYGNDVLVAYFVQKSDILLEKINEILNKQLPEYMMPSYFVAVDKFKITMNGKIDTKQLPDYRINSLHKKNICENSCSLDSIENSILDLCKNIIKYNKICLNDNFFQVGGNSLLMIELSMQIFDTWKVSVDIANLYECETIKDISILIKDKVTKNALLKDTEMYVNKNTDRIKATGFQRLLFNHEIKENAKRDKYSLHKYPTYNIIEYIRVNKYINAEKLSNAVDKVVQRQQALRITFELYNNEYYLNLHESCDGYFESIYCEHNLDVEYVKGYAKDFIIKKLPLFQLFLFENQKKEQVIMLNAHHAIFDYTSINVLINDIFKFYVGEQLPQIYGNYTNYIDCFNNSSKTECFKFWREYYRDRAECASFDSDITSDRLRILKDDLFSDEYFEITEKRLINLRRVCKKLKVSEYILLTSTFAVLLGMYCNSNDVVLGTYVPGRNSGNYNMIGLFIHMTGIRFRINYENTVSEYINEQNKNFIEVMKNQDVDHMQIYKELDYNDFVKGGLFSVIFNYVYQHYINVGDLAIIADDISEEPQTLPLSIKAFDDEAKIVFKLTYADRFYSKDFIEDICSNYRSLIDRMIDNADNGLAIKDFIIAKN